MLRDRKQKKYVERERKRKRETEYKKTQAESGKS
jgi:hypothetical protein